jgi:FeS assembly SUF system protein
MPKPVEIKHEPAPVVAPMSIIERSLFEHAVIEEIRTVFDPELPVNVYDLGLIYDVQVSDNKDVHIVMTLTSPMCPVAGILPGQVESAARATPSIGNVSVELTWDPPYTIDSMPEETRLMLGF